MPGLLLHNLPAEEQAELPPVKPPRTRAVPPAAPPPAAQHAHVWELRRDGGRRCTLCPAVEFPPPKQRGLF